LRLKIVFVIAFWCAVFSQFASMLFRFEQIPDPWQRCMEEGNALVRYHSKLAAYSRPGHVQLTIFHIPSFVDATGRTIRELRETSGFELQRVVWHQAKDRNRVGQDKQLSGVAAPTMSTATVELDSDWWKERHSMLCAMQIPLLPPYQWITIVDGERTGLHVEDRMQIEWTSEGPEGWKPLTEWTHTCIAYFERLLP
jgi:hypothetical protein